MNANSILHSDVLDILFENRNKQYGAYTLRKEYNKRLMTAIGGMFSLVAIVVGCLSFKAKEKPAVFIAEGPVVTLAADPTPPPQKKDPVIPKLKPKMDAGALKQNIATIQNTAPVITESETTVPPVEAMENKAIGTETKEGNASDGTVQPQGNGSGTGPGTGSDNATTPPAEDNTIYKSVEMMPEFPGGTSAMIRFLKKNLREITNEEERTIKVLVRFIVDKTGVVTGFEIVGSGGEEYDKEVLRVVKKMPHWKPGSQNGNPVNVYMTLPVVFQTEQE
ncbi:energy transducer TonB [Pinibacter aurantiacus]|uniref:TonB family protein n=1 Tax=Pinibacter aurantiacus TaxID=2851599 RepID=A0A9E2SG57_9BACT|nr:energy transducer TonB [Pinibacter aurantiacus]MBV4359845.1 TonB family protein [Pinibacter aurantiacus]